MKTDELVKIGESLGLEPYNINDQYVCFHGINGGSCLLYSDDVKDKHCKPATMIDFANHLKMMGRDSLRLELNSLLSITRHL
jgi:hypothetical protein